MATPRRRPSSSPTSRPRRLAGRGPVVEPAETHDAPPEPDPAPEPEPADPVVERVPVVELAETPVSPPEPAETHHTGPSGLLASARTTSVLIAVIVLLAVASLGGGAFLLLRDDDVPTRPAAATAPDGEALLTISPDDARTATAAAAQAAYTIVATSFEDYDAQVEEAAGLMTTSFAEEYRQTAADVRTDLVRSKTDVQVSVVAQGVVSANDTEVRALVFLNQFVTKNGKDAVFTPYRALVTVVNSDEGWLVADLETA